MPQPAPTTIPPPVGPLAYIRFLSEIALLVSLALVGVWAGGNVAVSIVLAIALPLAAAAIWGAFIGPKARRRLHDPARFAVEIVLFGAAAVGLMALGAWVFALVLAMLYAIGTPHGRAGG
jgi:hypothetical protein